MESKKAKPSDILAKATSLLIQQDPGWENSFTTCNFQNNYSVFKYSEGQKEERLFKCTEYSGCYARRCVA